MEICRRDIINLIGTLSSGRCVVVHMGANSRLGIEQGRGRKLIGVEECGLVVVAIGRMVAIVWLRLGHERGWRLRGGRVCRLWSIKMQMVKMVSGNVRGGGWHIGEEANDAIFVAWEKQNDRRKWRR